VLDAYVTPVGDFGAAVAARLAERYDIRTAAPPEIADSSRWPDARVHVVAAWRETPALFDLADRYAFITRRPWLPVALDATSLRVGPLVAGDAGPCYRCYLGRQFQHRRLRGNDRELFARYDADPACGVAGFLTAHVSLAALATGLCLDAAAAGRIDGERGRARRFALLSPQLSVSMVVPVDGCDRCGLRDPDATWRDLARDLAGIPAAKPAAAAGWRSR